jgi:hypothetical protein
MLQPPQWRIAAKATDPSENTPEFCNTIEAEADMPLISADFRK